MFRYLISYSFQSRTGFGTGNMDVDRSRPILDRADVDELRENITREIARSGYRNVVILSFSRYAPYKAAVTPQPTTQPAPSDPGRP